MSDETLRIFWDLLNQDDIEAIFGLLSNEQLLSIREKGQMDRDTMITFKTELYKRCLIEMDEVMAAYF